MLAPQHRRLLATAAAVSAFAFVIGWMLGRDGSHAGSGSANPTTTAATVPPALVGSALPTVDTELLAGTSTTPASGWTSHGAGVDERVAALGLHIIGVRPGRVLELDTAAGKVAELRVDARYQKPPHIDAGTDWILVRRTDISYAQLFQGQSGPIPIRLGYATNAFPEPGTDRFWRVLTAAERDAPTRVVEIDH